MFILFKNEKLPHMLLYEVPSIIQNDFQIRFKHNQLFNLDLNMNYFGAQDSKECTL